MYNMSKLILLALALGLIVSGCSVSQIDRPDESNANPEGIRKTYWAEYHETTCNVSPWGEDTAEQVIAYYSDKYSITIPVVEFVEEFDDNISCGECGCSTGKVMRAQVSLDNRKRLLELGFTKDQSESLNYVDYPTTSVNTNDDVEEAEIMTEEIIDALSDDNTNEDLEETTEEIVEIISDETMTETETTEVEPTGADRDAEEIANQIQAALSLYFTEHGNYPVELAELELGTTDLTWFTYTPIGTVPSKYYDLAVNYSTGKVILNP